MADNNDNTVVQTVNTNLDDIFAFPGGDNVVTQDDGGGAKQNVFSAPKNVDTTFLDKPDDAKTDPPKSDDKPIETPVATVDDTNILDIDVPVDDKAAGRPKTDKSGLVELTNKLIEAKMIVPFDDDKPLDKYSVEDFKDLFEANHKENERVMRDSVLQEIWDSWPEEMQYAADYVEKGGRDLKNLFKALSHVEETRELDPTNATHQEMIARQYLKATNFGSDEEIEEEVTSWKDLNKLEAKAKQFKPKLDNMKQELVNRQLAEQEQRYKQQQQASKNYIDTVYNTLKPAEINGLKLDKKTQEMLFSGLTQAVYPSIHTGRQTNLLGHLLEKYQITEPNHGLVAEVLWHLADPEGFKKQLLNAGETASTAKTVRMLKTEQGNRIASTTQDDDADSRGQKRDKLTRVTNIFKRS
jgi:hypothetical protein